MDKCGLVENMATEWKRLMYLVEKSLLNANIFNYCRRYDAEESKRKHVMLIY